MKDTNAHLSDNINASYTKDFKSIAFQFKNYLWLIKLWKASYLLILSKSCQQHNCSENKNWSIRQGNIDFDSASVKQNVTWHATNYVGG